MTSKPLILLFILLCGLFSGGAGAGPHKRSEGLSLDEAVREIRAQTGGRILSAKTTGGKGRRIHQIRVLTRDGRVRRFQLKAGRKHKRPGGQR